MTQLELPVRSVVVQKFYPDYAYSDDWPATLKKKMKSKSGDAEEASAPETSEYRCLVRATDGKKKISASVGWSRSSGII